MAELRGESPPLQLPADTLALLREFESDQAAAKAAFQALAEDAERQRVSTAQFRKLFGEGAKRGLTGVG